MCKTRIVNKKGESRIVAELPAKLLSEFDALCHKQGRTSKGYLKVLIERELELQSVKGALAVSQREPRKISN